MQLRNVTERRLSASKRFGEVSAFVDLGESLASFYLCDLETGGLEALPNLPTLPVGSYVIRSALPMFEQSSNLCLQPIGFHWHGAEVYHLPPFWFNRGTVPIFL
jgi:hypothetical protein